MSKRQARNANKAKPDKAPRKTLSKTIHFIAGLPRSGSTLLVNILAQNPRFHVTATSGILNVFIAVRDQWENTVEFKAAPPPPRSRFDALKGVLGGFFEHADKPVVFDKSRGWLNYIEAAEKALGVKVKVLVPVRDMRDVLASFEKLYRANKGERPVPGERENYFKFQTVSGRCEVWTAANQIIGTSYNRIKDAIARGLKDRMHYVEFEKLTVAPKTTLKNVYAFLDEEPFDHDFDNVKQVTQEDDVWHGYRDLHTIRPKVEALEPQWPHVLGKEVADRFAGPVTNFWQE